MQHPTPELIDLVQQVVDLDTVGGFIRCYEKHLNLLGNKLKAYQQAESEHETWFKGRRMYADQEVFWSVLSRYKNQTKRPHCAY